MYSKDATSMYTEDTIKKIGDDSGESRRAAS